MEPLGIALLQLAPAGTPAGNLEKGLEACRRAKALGADTHFDCRHYYHKTG